METEPVLVTEFRGAETPETPDSIEEREMNKLLENTTGDIEDPKSSAEVSGSMKLNRKDSGNDSGNDSGTGSTESQRPTFMLGGDDHSHTDEENHDLQIEVPKLKSDTSHMNGTHHDHHHHIDDPALATIAYSNHSFDVNYDETDPHERAVVSFVIEEESQNQNHRRRHQKGTVKAITTLLSLIYAMLLVLCGFAIPLIEAIQDEWLNHVVSSIFNIYLFGGSTCFLIYILVNIKIYEAEPVSLTDASEVTSTISGFTGKEDTKSTTKPASGDNLMLYVHRNKSTASLHDHLDSDSHHQDYKSKSEPNLLSVPEMTTPNRSLYDMPSRPHGPFASMANSMNGPTVAHGDIYDEVIQLNQTASLSHEGASFYFRIGALAFGIANFVFIVVQMDHYMNNMDDCVNPPDVYPLFFHLLFIIVQSFYIFKNTQVHIKKYQAFARFGFVHVLATNMCNWLRYLIFEVLEGIYYLNHEDEYDTDVGIIYGSENSVGIAAVGIAADDNNTTSCIHVHGLYTEVAPYLFPFVLEYSLIATATMAGMYHALNINITQDIIDNIKRAIKKRRLSSENIQAHMSHADHENILAKSHKGMFAGAILLGGAVISVVMFHFNNEEDAGSAQLLTIYYASDIAIHSLMIPSLFYCAYRLSKFRFIFKRDNSIDNTLLLIALAGLVLYYLFILISTISAFSDENIPEVSHLVSALAMSAAFINIIQGVLQGILVVAGLQMCAADTEQQITKPARGHITFLIIANLTVWIFKSFQVKAVDLSTTVDFYGSTIWPIIKNTGLPLVVFFRFHVSVCLAEIWNSIYHPDSEPVYSVLS